MQHARAQHKSEKAHCNKEDEAGEQVFPREGYDKEFVDQLWEATRTRDK